MILFLQIAPRQFDLQIDTDQELQFVSVGKVKQATLSATIQDGKILRVDIIDGGRGYKTIPTTKITTTTGEGAEIKLTINSVGSVITAEVIKSGRNYQQSDRITVRLFTVLTTTDTSFGNRWSLYEYIGGSNLEQNLQPKI